MLYSVESYLGLHGLLSPVSPYIKVSRYTFRGSNFYKKNSYIFLMKTARFGRYAFRGSTSYQKWLCIPSVNGSFLFGQTPFPKGFVVENKKQEVTVVVSLVKTVAHRPNASVSLTHCSLETPTRVTGKQCRPRSDAVSDQGLHCLQIVQRFFSNNNI